MNRRRVSSPPTARARLPLDLSHPFTALDARHATESTTEGPNRRPRDRIDDRGTESTTEGLNRRLRARITRNAMISTRNASTVPRTRSRRSKRSFVHVIARSSRSSRSVAVSRARRHSFHSRACTHARRARGGDTRRVTTHQYHFSCLFPPQTIKNKKKFNTRDPTPGGGDTHES